MRIQSLLVFLTAVLLSSSTPTAGNDDDGVTAEVNLLCYSCRGDCGRVGGRILGPRCNLRYEKELIFRENYGTLQIDLPKGGKLQRELGDWHNEPTLLLVIVTALPLSTTAVASECDRLEEMTTRVNPLYYDCGCSKYNRSDSYHNDLGILAGKLRSNISASDSNFFAFANVGSVYGFVLCRGDYKGPQCANSLNQTIQDAVLNPFICPFYKDVTIYSDQHMLSFSGDQYLIYKDDRPAWVASNMNYVKNGTATSDGVSYGERVEELLNGTADYAAFNSSDLYATGESWFGEGGVSMVYGLVQCRPDLKRELCRQCLAELISSIPKQFTTNSGDHRVGGRILGVRCNLRFEKDLFFKETNETSKLHMPKIYQMLELRRRIQIALLCVQENPDHRPHMREVTTMLSNND
uniref:Gnk2-homologous domain-containing protein n=1 Tax=Setaria italica TaxID=4555 RepID=K3XS88_SETIT